MNKGRLWLMGAGLTILQMMVGNAMAYYAPYPPLFYSHVVLALLLLLVSALGLRVAERGRERRIVLGNVFLVVVDSALGFAFLETQSNAVILAHFLLAIGLISNFSVLYGIHLGRSGR